MEHIGHACCIACAGCFCAGLITLFFRKKPTAAPIEPPFCKRCSLSCDAVKDPTTGKFIAICPGCKKWWPLAE